MKDRSRGYLIYETLIGIVILSLLAVTILPVITELQKSSTRSKYEYEAGLLVQQGLEAAYNICLTNWTSCPYGVYQVSREFKPNSTTDFQWKLLPGSEVGIHTLFTRKIEIMRVCRKKATSADGNSGQSYQPSPSPMTSSCIVDNLNELDPKSKLIRTTVTWEPNKKLSADLLLYNYNGN